MCRLCSFASSSKEFLESAESMYVADMDRLLATQEHSPDNPSVFTNIEDFDGFKFDFALFEPLMAFANPQNYYQPMNVDGQKLRGDWGSGWTRSLCFPRNGKILLYAKAIERKPFSEEEWFSYYFLVEFAPSQLQITREPPRFGLRADNVKIEGVNLLDYGPAEHTFNFAFLHQATEKSAMRAEAAMQSSFYKEILQRAAKQTGQASAAAQTKSDFERYLVTTTYFAPHPSPMLLCKQAGYSSRFEFQNAVPDFLDEHFGQMSAKAINKSE